MTRSRYRPASELSPFARLIREGYMWRQTPPLGVPDLAQLTGITKMTIWSWLNKNSRPRRDSLQVLHRVTGIPMDDLMDAAGYGRPTNDAVELARQAWRDIFTQEELEHITPYLREALAEALNEPQRAQEGVHEGAAKATAPAVSKPATEQSRS